MRVDVISIQDYTVLVQYEDASNRLQRCYLHRELLPTTIKGQPATVPDEFIQLGIPASDVDLVAALGETLPVIQVRDLQDQLRRAGLWVREDYQTNPKIVQGVLARMLKIDASTILNAAAKMIDNPNKGEQNG